MPLRLTPLRAAALLAALCALPAIARAQDDGPRTRYVISIGDHPRVDGLRINFRDREIDRVRGANVTLWRAYDDADLGRMSGLALGLPMTSTGDFRGIGVGVAGIAGEGDTRGILIGGIGAATSEDATGLIVGGVGAAAGGDLGGIAIGGVGVGAGGDLRGLVFGTVGVGAGGDIRGIAIGGIGAGVGGNVRGFVIGGVGAGAGGEIRGGALGIVGVASGGEARGLMVGGVGVGSGGGVRGVAIGGVGVGTGGDATGLLIGGVGVGAGGAMRGIAIGGAGIGAGELIRGGAFSVAGVGSPRIEGVAVGAHVRTVEMTGLAIAPAYFRAHPDAEVTGVLLSGVNIVEGHHHGLAISLVNYAHSMRGVQIGLVNVITENPAGRRWLPLVNWGDR